MAHLNTVAQIFWCNVNNWVGGVETNVQRRLEGLKSQSWSAMPPSGAQTYLF